MVYKTGVQEKQKYEEEDRVWVSITKQTCAMNKMAGPYVDYIGPAIGVAYVGDRTHFGRRTPYKLLVPISLIDKEKSDFQMWVSPYVIKFSLMDGFDENEV